jgi:hypothetical protein
MRMLLKNPDRRIGNMIATVYSGRTTTVRSVPYDPTDAYNAYYGRVPLQYQRRCTGSEVERDDRKKRFAAAETQQNITVWFLFIFFFSRRARETYTARLARVGVITFPGPSQTCLPQCN